MVADCNADFVDSLRAALEDLRPCFFWDADAEEKCASSRETKLRVMRQLADGEQLPRTLVLNFTCTATTTCEASRALMDALPSDGKICMDRLFDEQADEMVTHRFVGFVAYYMEHYWVYWRVADSDAWQRYDDASVSQKRETWQEVVEKMAKGRCQMMLAFFDAV